MKLLRESSVVLKRRWPMRWAIELMQAVPWKSAVVLTKKPQTSICQPLVPRPGAKLFEERAEAEHRANANSTGTNDVEAVEPDELGELGEVLHLGVVGGKVAAAVIQPMCDHQKPCTCGEWASSGSSECWWWWRW